MARIVQRQLSDVIGNISSIEPFDITTLKQSTPEDIFLCALGFEPRCLTLPELINSAGYKAHRAVYFRYSTNLDDNNINLQQLEANLSSIADKVEPLEADFAGFSLRFRTLLDLVAKESMNGAPRVTMDISVIANRLLLRSMKVLLDYDIHLRIIYSEAAIYHPTQLEYEKNPARWDTNEMVGLERGVSDIMPSIDYPGQALDQMPDFMIVFPTFKPDRTKAVISFVDPSLLTNPGDKVVWLLGLPHLAEDHWRLEAMKRINGISVDVPQYEVSTFDYKQTLQVLDRLHALKSENYSITLSPLGSKMQSLGVAIFCYMHPDVRVIYSIPKEYNAVQYSEGCKSVWEINFGTILQLRKNLDEVGTLLIED